MEFLAPRLTLDAVAGHVEAKKRLESDALAIRRGQLESAPMGYLICGPVGTGKSFIAECYAGSVGIPCAVLKNFRSKYVGETEGNLEHALDVLRGLGPVVVIIDEADAALGNREQGGDSGTSARVFSMIARQMGDTRYRGKIVWMLLTSRPDLLPIDLKRQGRAEVHIPLFYPHDQAEIDAMFAAMARKSRMRLAAGLPGPVDLELGLSVPTSKAWCWRPAAGRSSGPPRPVRRHPTKSARTISVGPWTTSCRRPKVWKRRCRKSPPCSNAPSGDSCPNTGARSSASPAAAPDSRSGWRRSAR